MGGLGGGVLIKLLFYLAIGMIWQCDRGQITTNGAITDLMWSLSECLDQTQSLFCKKSAVGNPKKSNLSDLPGNQNRRLSKHAHETMLIAAVCVCVCCSFNNTLLRSLYNQLEGPPQ